MVEPSFLALTTTPSIGPSSAEATWPASAAAPWAAAGEPQAASTRVDANAAVTTKARRRNCIAASLDSTCAIARRGQARGSAKLPEPRTAPAWRQALPAVWDVDLHLLPPRSRRRCAICCWPQNSAQPRTVASYLSSWMLGAVLARERKLGRGELGMRALLSQRLEALLGLVFQMFQAGSRRQFGARRAERLGSRLMANLPSVCARRPRVSGRKSGYVGWQFGGLSPLRGPLAAVAAAGKIANRAVVMQASPRLRRFASTVVAAGAIHFKSPSVASSRFFSATSFSRLPASVALSP